MIQEQCLSYLLETKDSSIITMNGITDEYFSDYKTEYNFIRNHLNKYGAIPNLETFLSNFPDFDLIQVTEPASYLLDELAKDRSRRFLADNYNKARQLIMNNDVDAAMNLLQQASNFSTSFVTLNAIDLIHDTSRLNSYEDKVENKDKYFITTGFRELDKILGGWNVNEDSATIVARNGLGKSWILFKCAAEAAKSGKRVGIYSGEMSEDSVGYRMDSIIGHISNGALVHGGGSVKNQYKNYIEALQDNVSGNLWVITPKQIHGFAKPSTLKAFIEKYNLDILFVDQYSLMIDDEGAREERIRLANISTALKLLQSTHHIPIIAAAQQNREKLEGDKAFDTTQIMGCDMIGQNSSVIIFIERKDDMMNLYLGKSRESGSVGTFLHYRASLNDGTWVFIPDENSEIESEDITDSNGTAYNEGDVF